jgi:multiple sugar transport system permease protein
MQVSTTFKPGTNAKLYRSITRIGVPYLFLSPFLILFCVFFLLPLVYALGLSLFTDRLIGGSVFSGLENYALALQDGGFWRGVVRVLLYGIVQVPIMLALALGLALVLDTDRVHGRPVFQLLFFLPFAIPSVIAALMWGYLYAPTFGPFTQIADLLHLPRPGFLTETGMLPSIGNIATWQFTGSNMIIMYSALRAVPRELFEAARIDGATESELARYIKIPLIVPAFVLTGVFSIIGSLQMFSEPRIMATLAPTVIGNDYTPNMRVYATAFTNQQYNYSAALSFTLALIIVLCTVVFLLVPRLWRRSSP